MLQGSLLLDCPNLCPQIFRCLYYEAASKGGLCPSLAASQSIFFFCLCFFLACSSAWWAFAFPSSLFFVSLSFFPFCPPTSLNDRFSPFKSQASTYCQFTVWGHLIILLQIWEQQGLTSSWISSRSWKMRLMSKQFNDGIMFSRSDKCRIGIALSNGTGRHVRCMLHMVCHERVVWREGCVKWHCENNMS